MLSQVTSLKAAMLLFYFVFSENGDVRATAEDRLLKFCKDKELKLNYRKHLHSAERQPCIMLVTALEKVSNKLCLVAFTIVQDHTTTLSDQVTLNDQGTLPTTSFLT